MVLGPLGLAQTPQEGIWQLLVLQPSEFAGWCSPIPIVSDNEKRQWVETGARQKIDSMAVEINHLRLDLREVADFSMVIEDDVDTLKQEVKSLRAAVEGLKCIANHAEKCLEDTERRLR
ncbi:hypothetical protein NDU88_002567 [Pleurodeles waltl]|uniref:Uncharacterized protein n=1 Tax=Pleurodeles waltl TaxID=8319 RepID=A0AAV7LCR3_PLEWA|nr:hypothetical protein NDU88_002567 [Pleurodeles waltl]